MSNRGLLLTIALPLVAACAHANKNATAEAPPAAPPPAPVAAAVPAPPPPAEAAPAPRACSTDDQCNASELCVSPQCVAITPQLAECRESAHFAFDKYYIRPADRLLLQRDARCLNALPLEKTLVEGNCDERGTVQYNIALGFRRAHAVAKYLEDLGVPAATLSEVSYGKELPLCTEATESCWARNRRADVDRGGVAEDIAARIRADERRETLAHTSTATHSAVHGRTPAKKTATATGAAK